MSVNESRIPLWMTAVSTVVAVFTLAYAYWEHRAKEHAETIAHWQRVVIYKIISEENGTKFQRISDRYLQVASKLQTFSLPQAKIQDDALRDILLDLQRDKLIVLGFNGLYGPYIEIPDSSRGQFEAFAKAEFARQQNFRVTRPAILRLLERESGKYNMDELLQRCLDERISIDRDFYNVVTELRTERLVNRDERGKLWLTHDWSYSPKRLRQGNKNRGESEETPSSASE